MKKILYLAVLTLALASCTDDYKDWAQQTPAADADAVNVTMTVGQAAAIDFSSTQPEKVQLFVPTLTTTADGVTTYDVTLYNDDKSRSVSLVADADGKVTATELQDAIATLYGKAPTQRSVQMDITALTAIGATTIKNTATSTLSVKLNSPVIESAYYYVGAANGWGGQDYMMSNGGGDVYENPVFTVTVPAQGGDHWFKIMPKSAFDLGSIWDSPTVVGVYTNGTSALTGDIVVDKNGNDQEGSGANSWCIKESENPGTFYRISINMLEMTYEITPLNFGEYIYMPGNPQGWNPGSAPALHSPNYDGVYTGYGYMDGDFKFTKQRDWSAEYNYGDFSSYDAVFAPGDGSNIKCTEAGYYRIVADAASGSLKATKLTWGLVGPATPGGWDAASYTVMTYNQADDCWEVTTELAADEFKFTTNGSWDINLGGSADDLVENGGNLRIDEAGTYAVKLYPSRSTKDVMYATIERQ